MLKDILNGLVTKPVAWKVTKTISFKEFLTDEISLDNDCTYENICSIIAYKSIREIATKEEREKRKQFLDASYLRVVFKPNEEEYTMYIPLSCFYEEDKFNRELDKDAIEVYILYKEGEEDIYRVK